MNTRIRSLYAREILDSRGNPTVEVETYNQLLRIEDELGDRATYVGRAAFKQR